MLLTTCLVIMDNPLLASFSQDQYTISCLVLPKRVIKSHSYEESREKKDSDSLLLFLIFQRVLSPVINRLFQNL